MSCLNDFPVFRIMPTPLAIFLLIYVICGGPVQFIINNDSEKLCFSHFHNSVPSNKNTFYGPRYTFGVKSIKFVLLILRKSLFALTHAYTLSISLLIWDVTSFRFYPVTTRFVSSAKGIGMKYSDACGKSFICNKNSKDLMMGPWGTPHLILLRSDWQPQ